MSLANHPRRQAGGWRTGLVLALLLGAFVLQLWTQATRTSATSDEPIHILAGYRYWQCADYTVNPEHPPVLKLLAALPLRFLRLAAPNVPCGARIASDMENFHGGALFLVQNGVDPVLLPARAAASVVSLVLALLVVIVAWDFFGPAEALVALTLLAFEPTVIAHGSLVTTDMALTASMFGAVYALYCYRRRPTVVRLLVTGLAIGVLLASKHTGVLVVPVLGLLLVADGRLVRTRYTGSSGGTAPGLVGRVCRGAIAYLVMLVLAVGVLWATYGFRTYALPGATQKLLSIAVLFGSSGSAGGPMAKRLVQLTDDAGVLPEAYMFGLAGVLAASERAMYLLGRVYPSGRWFYFPVAFVIKSSVALLVLLALGLLGRGLYRRHPREMLFLLLPSAAYFAISLTSGLNIGVRHILPVYPFCIVIAAAGACAWMRRSRVCAYLIVGLLLYHAGSAVRIAPSYIAFANDVWGGPRSTHRWLRDSNADWGQGLTQVEAYLEEQGIEECWIAAIGMADLVRQYRTCRKLPAFGWEVTERLVDIVPPVIEGTVLLSAWVLPPWGEGEYIPIAQTPPIDVIGGHTLVFRGRFEVPLVTALSYATRASQLLGWGRAREALADARTAVEWSPDDPRVRRVLALAYARNGLTVEAQRETDIAERLGRQRREGMGDETED